MNRLSCPKRCCCLLVLAVIGCSEKPPPLAPPEPPIVTVEKPVERLLENYFEFTGYLKAAREVEIRAQVTGYLKEVKFSDGQIVRGGDVLYEIDPEPYLAAKENAKANLTTAEAAIQKAIADIKTAEEKLTFAKPEFERQTKLLKDGGGSQSDYDKARSAYTQATSEVNAATAARDSQTAARDAAAAALRKAEFDLKNCTIRLNAQDITAPENITMKTPPDQIVGRVSRTLITEGNLVTAGTTVLCKVVSLNPIYAYWDVDEPTSLEYRRMIFDKKVLPDPRRPGNTLKCWLGLRDETGFPHEGTVNYIAPEIVRGTASREVRGVFPNEGYRLGPGDSARIKVWCGEPQKQLTIPEIAIGMRQQQKFVYVVVNKDGKDVAEFRPVVIGPVRDVNGVRLQVIEKGVTANDRVVVNGLLRVRPGAPVNAQEQTSSVSPPK